MPVNSIMSATNERICAKITTAEMEAASCRWALASRGTGPRIGPVSAPGAIALTVGILTWRRLVRGRAGYQSPMSRVQQLVRPVHE